MSIADLIKDPETYCKTHVVQFSHQALPPSQAGMQLKRKLSKWQGWEAIEFEMEPGQFTDFGFMDKNTTSGKGSHHLHTVEVKKSGVDKGIRYLPWQENAVTFMKLDGAAKSIYTGPLSGCSIFIAEDFSNDHWMFHVNRNNAATEDNTAIKDSMLVSALVSSQTVVKNIVCKAIYKQHYKDFGFVFGKRAGNKWKYFAVDTAEYTNPKDAAAYAALTEQYVAKSITGPEFRQRKAVFDNKKKTWNSDLVRL